jgi:hypothetical protein
MSYYIFLMPDGGHELDLANAESAADGGVPVAGPHRTYMQAYAALIDRNDAHPLHPLQAMTEDEFNNLAQVGQAKYHQSQTCVLVAGNFIPCRIIAQQGQEKEA